MKTIVAPILRVSALIIAIGLVEPALADPCADYPLLEDSRLGTAPTTILNQTFTRDGDIVYAGNMRLSGNGFQVFDVSDPVTPILLATVEGNFYVVNVEPRVVVSGNLGYVTGVLREIPVYDLSNPRAPHLWTQIPMPLEVWAVAAEGDLLYTASWGYIDPYKPDYTAVHVLDVSDPVHAVTLGELWEEGMNWTYAMEVRDGVAYLGASGGLRILDVSNPTTIVEIAQLSLGYPALFIHLEGDLLHAMAGSVLHVVDVADPASPVIVSSTETEAGPARGFSMHGGIAVSSHHGLGLRMIDVSDPEQPSPVSVWPALAGCFGVSVEPERVIVMKDDELIVAAPEFPDAVDPLGEIGLTYFSRRLHQENGRLYTLHGWELLIHDVADPADPVLLGSFADGNAYSRLSLDGDVLYLASQGYAGAVSVDVSDPTDPRKLAQFTGERVNSIHAVGGKVAVGLRDGGVQLFDASDPSAPVLLGSVALDPGYRTYGVAYVGDHVYATSHTTHVLDVSDPTHMQVVASMPTGYCFDLVADGPWIYVGDEDWLRVLRFTPPASLQHAAILPQVDRIEDMHLAGNLLHVASRESGVHLFDVTDPTATRRVGAVPPMKEAYGVTGEGGMVTVLSRYATTGPQAMVRFHPVPCGLTAAPDPDLPPVSPLQLTAAPNPFNPRVDFSFSTPQAGRAELAVFDLRGRRIAIIHEGYLAAGPQRFQWNGRNDGGRPVASGGYVARLEAGGVAVSRPVTLVR